MKLFIFTLSVIALAMADENEVARSFQHANELFTFNMFQEVAKLNPGKSIVMSGLSAMTPLAELALASVGDSHDEILNVIGFPNDNVTIDAFTLVSNKLRSVRGVDLKIANRIFVPSDVQLNEEFNTVSRDVFQSDVKAVNFAQNVEAATTINKWVEDNTNNRIKDLVDPDSLNSDTRAVLVNAVYFKGSWKEKFNPSSTREADFHVTKDKTVKVQMMYKSGDFKFGYSQELDAQLLELFYEGEETSFLIVLPNKVDGITELQEKLKDPTALQQATQKMSTREVDVYIPKFKIETTIDLKSVLQNMGVKKLFGPQTAKLDKLIKNEGNLYVSDAIQKAFIEVNEEGAEAAAASGYIVCNRFGGFPDVFLADKPFYFALIENNRQLYTGSFNPLV